VDDEIEVASVAEQDIAVGHGADGESI
jgi:hypothetical protein